MSEPVSRRALFAGAGAAGAAAALSAAPGAPRAQGPAPVPATAPAPDRALFFFNEPEARFVEAAVERLIPADPEWPGAAWAGVLHYIDGQLAAAYGAGGGMYLKGPWRPDAPPQQGYQLRYSPAELYRVGIEESRAHVRETHAGREFWELAPAEMDAALKALESGETALPSLPAPVFFETLLANTVEGFLADPAYGGNREAVGWRMIGFPGAYAQFLELVDRHGYAYERAPIGMADDAARLAHIHAHP
jgi:gluconate 2-dehydrogenase gamma chain